MSPQDFLQLLQNPDQVVSPIQTNQLEEVLEEYPYFQSARALHLKGLKNLNSFKYNNALKVTAAYTADREVLFDLITSETFLQNSIADSLTGKATTLLDTEIDSEEIVSEKRISEKPVSEGQASKSGRDVNRPIIEDTSLNLTKAEADALLDPKLFTSKKADAHADENSKATKSANADHDANKDADVNGHDDVQADANLQGNLKAKGNQVADSAKKENAPHAGKGSGTTGVDTEILNIGEPLPFDKREKYSFAEWLNLTSLNPIKRNEKKASGKAKAKTETGDSATGNGTPTEVPEIEFPLEDVNPKKKKFELIDKFISENPKIKPQKEVQKIAIGDSVRFDHRELMTETLAKVYLEQKKYKKAIQAYKILSLKYPDKSGFFADRIKAVKRLKDEESQ